MGDKISDATYQNKEWFKMTDNVNIPELDVSYDTNVNDLSGTYFTVGLDRSTNKQITHLLDGYNTIMKFVFSNGKLILSAKRIKDDLYEKETKSNKILKKGIYILKSGGILNNIFDFNLARNTLHSPIYFGGKLIGCSSTIYFMFNKNLELEDTTFFDKLFSKSKSEVYCIHPLIQQKKDNNGNITETLHTFTFYPGFTYSTVTFFEINTSFKIINRISFNIAGFSILHGFAFTDNYYILFQLPGKLKILPFVLGISPILRGMDDTTNEKTQIYIIPRDNKNIDIVHYESVIHGSIYHTINAYETVLSNNLTSIQFESFLSKLNSEGDSSQFEMNDVYPLYTNYGEIYHYSLNKKEDQSNQSLLYKLIISTGPKFSNINRKLLDNGVCLLNNIRSIFGYPKFILKDTSSKFKANPPRLIEGKIDTNLDLRSINDNYRNNGDYHYVYTVSHDFDHDVEKLHKINIKDETSTVYLFPAKHWLREPKFISRQNSTIEDDGYIILLAYTVNQTKVYIFDAKDITSPIKIINLGLRLPFSVHAHSTNYAV
jgi:carotenoid cleavage dioxygenase-like enzyme